MLDIDKLLRDCGVSHEPMNRRGAVTLGCPKCGSRDNLAWLAKRGYFRCWSCGVLPLVETLAQVTGLPAPSIGPLLQKYQVRQVGGAIEETPKGGAEILKYPDGTGSLLPAHVNYLRNRGLDPDQVQQEFGKIYGTPPEAPELPNRIIVPLYLNGRAVSWQARNIHPLCDKRFRYHTCEPSREVVWHKECVYGLDSCIGDTGVVVEGVFDVFKCGPNAIHVFGTSWLDAQLRVIAGRFKRVFVMFDAQGPDDPQGKAQAAGLRLAQALAGLGVDAAVADPESSKDPGDWPIAEARAMMRKLLES